MMTGRVRQNNINLRDGDVVGNNKTTNNYYQNDTKLSRLFCKLKEEVENNEKLKEVCEELNRYLTDKDPIGLEQKLINAEYDEEFIELAAEKKEYFSKKLYKYYEFESAQFIYVELLALIKTNFEDYIKPLINSKVETYKIQIEVREKVINPIIELLRFDSSDDFIINLNAEEVKGMIYYLTRRCHINWDK